MSRSTPHPDTFASRLRALRAAAAMSQGELARRAGLSRHYISRLERGEHEVSLAVARQLAVALGQRLDCWE